MALVELNLDGTTKNPKTSKDEEVPSINFSKIRDRKKKLSLKTVGKLRDKAIDRGMDIARDVGDIALDVGEKVVGAGEVGLALGTGALSFPLQQAGKFTQIGSESLAKKIFEDQVPEVVGTPTTKGTFQTRTAGDIATGRTSPEDILARGRKLEEDFSFMYEPRTETGKVLTEKAGEYLDKVLDPVREPGKYLQEKGIPAFLLPVLGMGGATSPIGIKAKAFESVSDPMPRSGEFLKLAGELALFEATGGLVKGAKVRFKNTIKDLSFKELEGLAKDIEAVPKELPNILDKADIDILRETVKEAQEVVTAKLIEADNIKQDKVEPVDTGKVTKKATNKLQEEVSAVPKEEIAKEGLEQEAAAIEVNTVKDDLLRSTVEDSKIEIPVEGTSLKVIRRRRAKPEPDIVDVTESKLREQAEPLTKWLEGDESIDINTVGNDIRKSLTKLDHRNTTHMDLITSGDQMLVAISNKLNKDTKPGYVLEETGLSRDMRTTEAELDAVIDFIENGHEKLDFDIAEGKLPDLIADGDPYVGGEVSLINDLKTSILEVWGNEIGAVGEGFTPERVEAFKRISQKLKFEGRTLKSHLLAEGVAPDQVKMIMDTLRESSPTRLTFRDAEASKTGADYQDILPDGDFSEVIKQSSLKSYKKPDGTSAKTQNIPTTAANRTTVKATNHDMKRGVLNRSFETASRTFDEMDIGITGNTRTWKETLYYPERAANKIISDRIKVNQKEMKELSKDISSKSKDRINIAWWAEQFNGKEILEKLRVKPEDIPTLTPKESAIKDILQKKYDDLWVEVNEMRVRVGQRPMKLRENYVTFAKTQRLLKDLNIDVNMVNSSSHLIDSTHALHKSTAFNPVKSRGRKAIPEDLDPFKTFEGYHDTAVRHIHMSPIVAKVSAMLDYMPDSIKLADGTTKKGKLSSFNPVAADFLHGWSDRIAGFKGETGNLKGLASIGLRELSKNLLYATLSGNIRTVAIQPSVLINTYKELGLVRTVDGMIGTAVGTNFRSLPKELATLTRQTNRALKKSKHLSVRNMDASFMDFHSGLLDAYAQQLGAVKGKTIKGKIGRKAGVASLKTLSTLQKGKNVVGKLGLKPMTYVDMLAAEATFRGAYAKATKDGVMWKGKKQKLTGDNAINYADDVVIRTNASGLPADISPIQATAIGRTLTMFQTFVINNWNFLVKDTAGIGRKDITNPQAVKNVTRMIIAGTIVNMIYEDGLGINSPLPTPIRAFYKSQQEDDSIGMSGLKSGAEFLELVPGLGGLRYGSNLLGPGAELTGDLGKVFTDDPFKKSIYEVGGKVLGVPATAQIGKSTRAAKRGENLFDTILGNYTGKKSSGGRETRTSRKSKRISR